MESAKRRAPAPVRPLVVHGVRYEPLRSARDHGFAQDGGVIAAIDAKTDEMLWTAQLYVTPFDSAEERDVQEVCVNALALAGAGQALVAIDEHGRAWSVDLATRAVTPVDATST
jgi:hypothetical protein